jgi:2-keto-4-pentenoate hydratase/2-oxohepta-3-ene-1,7-dioic acid hydratase in catechol pathway
MKLATLALGGDMLPALVCADRVAVLDDAAARCDERLRGCSDVLSLLRRWEEIETPLRRLDERLDDLVTRGDIKTHGLEQLSAPIRRPGKVIAVGRNYADHARELGNELPTEPMLFAKFPTSVIGPFEAIPRPAFVDDMDYEAELAVVIGRPGRDIAEADAMVHVAGYCCANDVSARAAQMATGQFVRGKSFDGFCPMGPALVTSDEVGDPQHLQVICRVDGQVMQDSSTSLMIFSVAALVAHCSSATTLEAGDVILTGTPSGVAMGRNPSPWLQPGQLCEVEIARVGRIANPITSAGRPALSTRTPSASDGLAVRGPGRPSMID